MKRNKQKLFYNISLSGTILFALLTFFILFAPFQLIKPWLPTDKIPRRGIDFINGSLNELNGVKVNCDFFIIITIILSVLIIVAVLLRGINKIPKYTKLISSAVVLGLSILLMVCAIVFFIKLNDFNKIIFYNGTGVGYGVGAFLYLIFGIMTALFSISLFIIRIHASRQTNIF